jgi:hypothetical protein
MRIRTCLARGKRGGFWRRNRLHRLGAAALAAGPRQSNLRFSACSDCGFHPAAFFFHGLFLSDPNASLELISLGNAAAIGPKSQKLQKMGSRILANYGGSAQIKAGHFPQLSAVLETISASVAPSV